MEGQSGEVKNNHFIGLGLFITWKSETFNDNSNIVSGNLVCCRLFHSFILLFIFIQVEKMTMNPLSIIADENSTVIVEDNIIRDIQVGIVIHSIDLFLFN